MTDENETLEQKVDKLAAEIAELRKERDHGHCHGHHSCCCWHNHYYYPQVTWVNTTGYQISGGSYSH